MKTKLYLLVAGVLLATAGAGLAQSPTITDQPQNQTNTISSSSTATFTVGATGTEPLSYQWQQAFDLVTYADRPEGTNTTLVITNVGNLDSGNYRVIITNVEGSVTSVVARLYVGVAPLIGHQPTNWPVLSLGASTGNRVSASGLFLNYQWRRNGEPLSGQTRTSIILTNLQVADEGDYDVLLSSPFGSTNSRVVSLVLDPTFTKITTGRVVTDLGSCAAAGCWADYDGDGYPDLCVARFNLGTSAIYHNNRDGTFARMANLPFQNPQDWFDTWADFDNDGRLDLVNARFSSPLTTYICFDNGQGSYSTVQFGLSPSWFSCAIADYNRDGFLDLYVANVDGSQNRLYRNNGNRSFTLRNSDTPSIPAASFGGPCWGDYNDDNWPDLYVPSRSANRSFMFRNDGRGHLLAATNLVTLTPGPAMAGAWGDYDNDGRLDLCVVCFNGTTAVYRNLGNGDFERPAGTPTLVGPNNFAAWADYDNDGFLDLFVSGSTNGNKLFHNNGDGTFTQITTGSIVNDRPMGGAGSYTGLWFDYDNDGFLDLCVFNGDDSSSILTANFLYHNNGNSNAWLKVKLLGTVSNRDAVGAKVRALATYAGQSRWQRRDISSGNSYNGNQRYAHFGLGDATNVTTLRIEWPSGTVEEFSDISPRQFLTIVEPSLRGALGSDGLFHLNMTMSTNRVYCLESSSDLVHWTSRTNCTGSGSCAAIEFIDPETPLAHAARYYRMR